MALLLSLLDKRARGIAFVVALTLAAFGALARLRVDLSIELFFPKKHESRLDYDRYRATFGLDDAKAIVVVEAPDLFTSEGLARVKALEEEFRAMPEVVGVQGPSTAQDVTSDGASVSLKKLFRAEMSADELAAAKATATTDPMFRYGLAHPDGRSVNVAVTLRREIASVENVLASSGSPFAAQYLATNRFARTGMSTWRSLSDGSRMEKALTR